jgi:hypothetical protein
MKIKRVYKKTSLKFGQEEIIDEARMRLIAGQTALGFHSEGACGTARCFYCPEPAMNRLKAGAMLDQFFATFELIEA